MVTVWSYIQKPAGFRLNDADELEDPDFNDRHLQNAELIAPLEILNAYEESEEE